MENNMATVYRIISRDDNTVKQFRDAYHASIFLLGQRLSTYIAVKSDDLGDRVILWPSNPELTAIEETLKSR